MEVADPAVIDDSLNAKVRAIPGGSKWAANPVGRSGEGDSVDE
jgi:hypothetical protein